MFRRTRGGGALGKWRRSEGCFAVAEVSVVCWGAFVWLGAFVGGAGPFACLEEIPAVPGRVRGSGDEGTIREGRAWGRCGSVPGEGVPESGSEVWSGGA